MPELKYLTQLVGKVYFDLIIFKYVNINVVKTYRGLKPYTILHWNIDSNNSVCYVCVTLAIVSRLMNKI